MNIVLWRFIGGGDLLFVRLGDVGAMRCGAFLLPDETVGWNGAKSRVK